MGWGQSFSWYPGEFEISSLQGHVRVPNSDNHNLFWDQTDTVDLLARLTGSPELSMAKSQTAKYF